MEIAFATEVLKEVCLARAPKASDLPREVIGALHAIYNAMRNADHVGELPYGQPEPGQLNSDLMWRIDLVDGYGVIMQVNHTKPPMLDDVVDLTQVYRLQVIEIEAPHA